MSLAGFIHPKSLSDSGELERCSWFLGPLLNCFCHHAAPDNHTDFSSSCSKDLMMIIHDMDA